MDRGGVTIKCIGPVKSSPVQEEVSLFFFHFRLDELDSHRRGRGRGASKEKENKEKEKEK